MTDGPLPASAIGLQSHLYLGKQVFNPPRAHHEIQSRLQPQVTQSHFKRQPYHKYMFQPVDDLGRHANWPIRFGNYGQFATPLRRFAYWMASMRTNVTTTCRCILCNNGTNSCDKGDR